MNAVLRIPRVEIAGARHFRGRVMRPSHAHVGLRQIVVQRCFVGTTGDCLLEKWYAFCESGLLEYRNPEVRHGFNVGRIGLHRLAELRLRLCRTVFLHQAHPLGAQLLGAVAGRNLRQRDRRQSECE